MISDQVETDFELGYAVTLEGTLTILDTIRKLGDYLPRLVFASSIDGYRPFQPEPVANEPNNSITSNSYATQKAIEELLEDSTRKGVLTATSIRLPTIVIRPGPPDSTVSSFLSSIVREPLYGRETELSVSKNSLFTIASWHAAVGYLIYAALYVPILPGDRVLAMPGISLTVQQMVDALGRVAGNEVVQRIRYAPIPIVMQIVDGGPATLVAQGSLELGFQSDESSFEAILIHYMKEEGLLS